MTQTHAIAQPLDADAPAVRHQIISTIISPARSVRIGDGGGIIRLAYVGHRLFIYAPAATIEVLPLEDRAECRIITTPDALVEGEVVSPDNDGDGDDVLSDRYDEQVF